MDNFFYKTLENYFENRFQNKIRIGLKTRFKRLQNRHRDKEFYYSCLPFEKTVVLLSDSALDFVSQNLQGKKYLNLIIKRTYLSILKNKYFSKLIIPEYFWLKNRKESDKMAVDSFFSEEVIVGEHPHRVRAYNLKQKKVLNILKEGFPQFLMKNEIEARKKFSDMLSIPQLINYGEDFSWYEERFVKAQPLKTLTGENLEIIEEIQKDLMKLYLYKGLKQIPCLDYFNNLYGQVMNSEKVLKIMESKKIEILRKTKYFFTNKVFHDFNVCVSSIHGDFHKNNILYDKDSKKTYLIDWELKREGSILYDIYHLLLQYELKQGKSFFMEYLLNPSSVCPDEIYQFLKPYEELVKQRLDSHSILLSYFFLYILETICQFKNQLPIPKNRIYCKQTSRDIAIYLGMSEKILNLIN